METKDTGTAARQHCLNQERLFLSRYVRVKQPPTHRVLVTSGVPSPLQRPALGCTGSCTQGQARRNRAIPGQLHSMFLPHSRHRTNSSTSPQALCTNQSGHWPPGTHFPAEQLYSTRRQQLLPTPCLTHTEPPSPCSHIPSHCIPHPAPFHFRRVYSEMFKQLSTYSYRVQQSSCSKK